MLLGKVRCHLLLSSPSYGACQHKPEKIAAVAITNQPPLGSNHMHVVCAVSLSDASLKLGLRIAPLGS